MEPTFKTAIWTPAWYGQDQSFAKGIMDIIFVKPGDETDFELSASMEATAVKTIISSISHPDYGDILGVYNDGLELYVAKADGEFLIVDSEEELGDIRDSDQPLSSEPFNITLRNPIETGVTGDQYRSLFIQKTRRMMADFRRERITKLLRIPQAEQSADDQLPARAESKAE